MITHPYLVTQVAAENRKQQIAAAAQYRLAREARHTRKAPHLVHARRLVVRAVRALIAHSRAGTPRLKEA
jgi:hypothetical protein